MSNIIITSASKAIPAVRRDDASGAKMETVSKETAKKTSAVKSTVSNIVEKGPPIDAMRVAELRQAIASGEYVPDSEKIADAMMRLDLLSAQF